MSASYGTDGYHDDYLHCEIDGLPYEFVDADDYYDYLQPVEL